MKYTSIDRIFAKFNRNIGGDFSEDDLIEWTGEALDEIDAKRIYEETVALIEVKNYQAELPNYLQTLIQVAKYNEWDSSMSKDNICPKKVIENKCERNDFRTVDTPCGCSESGPLPDFIALDCEGKPINDYDLAYYRPYFDLQYEYSAWSTSRMFREKFTPVHAARSNFFNISTHDKAYEPLYKNYRDEYSIIEDSIIRFSFKEGLVAIAYDKQKVDDNTGYPLIPDHTIYTTAIVAYINFMIRQKEFYEGRDGSKGRFEVAENSWYNACRAAKNKALMPRGDSEYQELVDEWQTLLPRQYNFKRFFGANPTIRERRIQMR